MNTKTIRGKTLGIFLSLVLVLSMAAVMLPATPAYAAVTVVTVTGPTAGVPAYNRTGGSQTIAFDVTTNVGVLGDISIKILVHGSTTETVATKDVQFTFTGATDSLSWPVTLTGVASGSYDVQVSAREPSGSGPYIDSVIQSNALIVDNTVPVVTLISPNGSEYVKSDADYTIQWNATDAIPAVANVTVSADFSIDGGTIWAATNIVGASKPKGVSSATWTAASIPNTDTQLAKIRLTVVDDAGNSTPAISASNFTILHTGPGVSISLPIGSTSWNGGSSQNITFTTTSTFNLNVDYRLEFYNGTAWSDITSGYVTNQPVGLITYPWTVNNTYRGSAAQIRVTVRDKVARTNTATSVPFTIVDVTAPTVTVTLPAAGDKMYEIPYTPGIGWTANDNVGGATTLTYNWYFSTDGGTSYTFLATSTEAQGPITKPWTPSVTATSTTCKIKVTATDAATPTTNMGTGYSGTFTVIDTSGGTTPTVTVSAPATAASWQEGTCQTISWNTTYTPDPDALLTIDIGFSSTGAGPYTSFVTIPNQSVGSGSFSWAVPLGSAGVSSRIQVTATAPDASSGFAESGVFIITTADPAVITAGIPITAGSMNLISLNLVPTCTSPASVLAPILPWVNSVWYYTGGPSGTWQPWGPGSPPGMFAMEAGKAYWVDVKAGAPGGFLLQGRKCASGIGPPPSYSTVAGWNMVGFKSTANKKVQDYLGLPCPSTVYMLPIYRYSGGYVAINDCNTTDMLPGRGYWIYYNTAGTIFPGCD